jgi:phosphatidylglycerophosphate synthase
MKHTRYDGWFICFEICVYVFLWQHHLVISVPVVHHGILSCFVLLRSLLIVCLQRLLNAELQMILEVIVYFSVHCMKALRLMRLTLSYLSSAFYVDSWWGTTATTSIFIAAAVTDWLDGYLARKVY